MDKSMSNFSIKEKYLKFLLYVVVIVLINVAGITLFFRADLTNDKIFSLSPASEEVVATLSEPLSIKIFFSDGSSALGTSSSAAIFAGISAVFLGIDKNLNKNMLLEKSRALSASKKPSILPDHQRQ